MLTVSFFTSQLRFKKHYFWLGDEPVPAQDLNQYLRGEKPDVAQPVAAWSSQTGKGLLYFSKDESSKRTPFGVLNLVRPCPFVCKHTGSTNSTFFRPTLQRSQKRATRTSLSRLAGTNTRSRPRTRMSETVSSLLLSRRRDKPPIPTILFVTARTTRRA